jgi:hypothetical protein
MQRHLILLFSFGALASPVYSVRAQPAPPPLTTHAAEPVAAPPAEPPPEPPPEEKPPEAGPRRIAVAKDSEGAFLTFGLLMQNWFVWDVTTIGGADGDTSQSTTSFRIRRIEISGSGELVPKLVRYRFTVDPWRVRDTLSSVTVVGTNGQPVTIRTPATQLSILQDFYITFISNVADVSLGQFKNPVSWEGFNSTSRLLMPERAFVANLVGGQRDLGIRVEKTFTKFGYMAGLLNGAGQNNFDNNNQKDIGLRLEVYPVKGMTIAGVTYDSIGYRSRAGTKDRWEADFRYETGPYLVQSEYIRNRDVTSDGAVPINSHGFYVAAAYLMKDIGAGRWKGNLQPVVRFGFFDPNTEIDVDPAMPGPSFGSNDERMDYEVGLNYLLRNHELKFQASYDRQQFDQRTANNQVIVAAQLSY